MPHEVTEETREMIHVLELDRTPRPAKLAAERAYFDGAHEVRFTERSFRPKRGADLDDIRAFVDSLEIVKRELAPLPPAPVSVPVSITPKIPDHFRIPLEAVIRGALISVETVHRVGTSTVVDVAWESEDEGERRALYIIENDVAKPYENVASNVDDLPPPRIEPAAPSPESEPATAAPEAPAKKERKGLLGRFRKGDADAQPQPPAAEEPKEEKKRRFGFGRGK